MSEEARGQKRYFGPVTALILSLFNLCSTLPSFAERSKAFDGGVRKIAACIQPDFGNPIHNERVSQFGGLLSAGEIRESADIAQSQPWNVNDLVGSFICVEIASKGVRCFEIVENYQVSIVNVVACDSGPCPGTGTFNQYVVAEDLLAAGLEPGDPFTIYTPGSCDEDILTMEPSSAHGYLVLNKAQYPEVFQWLVTIIRRDYSAGGSFEDSFVAEHQLPPGVNYMFVPTEYRHKNFGVNYLAEVSGLDTEGNQVASVAAMHLNDHNNLGPDVTRAFDNGLNSYVPTECRKTCISGTYAYSIQQYKRPTMDLSRFQVDHAFQAFDPTSLVVNPYYWYTKTKPSSFPADPTQLIQLISGNGGNVTVRDPAGNPLHGKVYGHKKNRGPWEGARTIATKNTHAIGDEFCFDVSHSLATAIVRMNADGDFSRQNSPHRYPELECVLANNSSGGGRVIPIRDPTPPKDFKNYVTFAFCLVNGILVPCEDQPDDLDDRLNPDIVDQVTITNLNDSKIQPISINFPKLLGDLQNGLFEEVQFTLEPSLYSFGFMCKDGIYRYGIRETTSEFHYLLTSEVLEHFLRLPEAPALEFDGQDDYVEVADTFALNSIGSGDFTFEAWYAATEDEQLAHPTLMSNRPSQTEGVVFFFHNSWNGSAYKIPAIQLNGVNYIWDDPPKLLDGAWHHFAARKKGDTLTYFSDGQEIQQFTGSDIRDASIAANHPLWIGWDAGLPSATAWGGKLDELRIWNTARTQAQIQSSMHSVLDGTERGLVASWSLSEGAGQATADATGVHSGQLGSTSSSDMNDPSWVNAESRPEEF